MNTTKFRLSEVKSTQAFSLAPDAQNRDALAAELDILGIKKLTFSVEIAPYQDRDWRLTAKLGATVVQTCVVTLEPVSTRIDVEISRTYVADMPEEEIGSEVEMPEDDTIEEAPAEIEIEKVMAEALSLALPDWPRKEGVEPMEMAVTEPGTDPLKDEDLKPFAGLKALKDKMSDKK